MGAEPVGDMLVGGLGFVEIFFSIFWDSHRAGGTESGGFGFESGRFGVEIGKPGLKVSGAG